VFNSIIGQDVLVDQLQSDFSEAAIPPALLLFGKKFSGKLSVALELARILTCTQKGLSDCPCASCSMQKKLLHPTTFLLGGRYFKEEITLAIQSLHAYLHHNKPVPPHILQLVIQCVRKLIRRFDSTLWEHDDSRYKEAKSIIPALNDDLLELEQVSKVRVELLNEIESKSLQAAKILDNYAVNVAQIRATMQHCHALAGEKRIVIIEQAHLMQESARNSLLKTLEEPQAKLYFILITHQKEAIMPTILSRVRPYAALARSPEVQTQVVKRVFGNSSNQLLEDLLSRVSVGQMRELAAKFLQSAKTEESIYFTYNEAENALLYQEIPAFLQALQHEIMVSTLQHYWKSQLLAPLPILAQGLAEYNQNPEVLLFSLHAQLIIIYKKIEKSLNK
jgi:DNA polymerase III delta prime subunit